MTRRRTIPAWLVAAVLAAVYLIVDPPSADLAAQTYRTWLFEHHGFVLWDNGWYGGHHNPAYSILFPPLAALTSPQLVGAVAAVVSAWAFERLVAEKPGGRPAAYWFAIATQVSLVTGRLTFALGVAFALLAVLALARGRLWWCAIAGAGAALASPVAAAFLALALLAWGIPRRRTVATAALLAATLAPALLLSVLFPEGGSFPFVASAFWPTLAGTLLVIAVLWRSAAPGLRIGLGLYAVLLVISAALSTPMGGNAVRLGALFAGPLAALTLWPDRRRALFLLLLPLLYWQWSSPVDDVVRASGDASVHASYYDGMLAFLHGRQAAEGPFRIEIPFTDNHWESARVAPTVPLARGWERQLDRKVNPLFYDGRRLTGQRYLNWLHANAVRYVALADAPIDYSAAAEAKRVRNGDVPGLREVFHDAHWRVFAVPNPTPLATGARVVALGHDSVDLDVPRAGRVHLKVRFTPYWKITRGAGCVMPDGAVDTASTAIDARRPGRIRLSTRFSLRRIRATSARCSG
ncbi:hypothetical protein [Baekduia sp.]|uniref:hypothetical protein n=1 Tax=Baekduia sp. TaxID=2600305 RepID=UPI002DF8EE94|nr:hypothetical protein [Baekduia sp.]